MSLRTVCFLAKWSPCHGLAQATCFSAGKIVHAQRHVMLQDLTGTEVAFTSIHTVAVMRAASIIPLHGAAASKRSAARRRRTAASPWEAGAARPRHGAGWRAPTTGRERRCQKIEGVASVNEAAITGESAP